MRYIDFFWSEDHREDWKRWCEENEVDEDEPDCRTGYIERGAGVMDYYFRLLCIAAYRRVCKSSEEKYHSFSKEDILETLLEVCPPDSASHDSSQNDRRTRQMNQMLNHFTSGLGGLGGFCTLSDAPRVNMAALESNHGIKQRLAAIGLEPMIEWICYGCQTDNIPGTIIVACAAMFTAYLEDVPTEAYHLEGTPYEITDYLPDNLDSNGCVEYKAELEPCFRITARFGESCYAQHC